MNGVSWTPSAEMQTPDLKGERLPYMPQLDAVRAFAVLTVVIHHYSSFADLGILASLGAAFLGVKLFFVLSGFLITGILLRSRDDAEAMKQTRGAALGHFYARRFLRIFPLYYFVIAVAFAVNLDPVRENLLWLLTYTLNIHMVNQGYYIANFAHFWSLAVEEQYYFAWPWIVLFAPRRLLIPLTLTMISVGPLYRFYGVIAELKGIATYIFTPACLDALGMGSLLAILSHSDKWKHALNRQLTTLVLPIGLGATVAFNILSHYRIGWKADTVLFDLAVALLFCWLINGASRGFQGVVGAVLKSKPLVYTGKISYGIYIYHPLAPALCVAAFQALGFHLQKGARTTVLVFTVATFAIASLSWYFMEKPINNLKRYFN
jgi:peptidoglycan/LPS O-acetylase OafA/YrhL